MTRTDPIELARIRQRQFYLDMAERFAKMADEYEPIRYAENPIPIHGFTAVIVAHGSDHPTLEREIKMISMDWYDRATDFERRDRADIHDGRHSVRLERIYPEQTEDSYRLDLVQWSNDRSEQARLARVAKGEQMMEEASSS